MIRVTENLRKIRDLLAFSAVEAEREPSAVKLLAVSKKQPLAKILEAASAGQCDFGENFVQEGLEKISQTRGKNLIWHFIGPYGYDKPLVYQYWVFNLKLLQGDLGNALAWDKRPALDVVWERIPATIQLTSAAMILAVVFGVVIGAISASRPDSLFDRVGKVVAITGQSMPVFWVGLLLILLFSVYLGWLPSAGVGT